MDYSFESKENNPFVNKAKYFIFPDLLKKNVLENDEEILIHLKIF